jgi:hypothetical protein
MHPRTAQALGLILIGIGIGIGAAFWVFLRTQQEAGELTPGGFGAGLILLSVIVLPIIGAGLYISVRGLVEGRRQKHREQLRRIAGVIQVRGRITLSELALEMGISMEELKKCLYELGAMGAFKGYADWQEGVLYCGEMAALVESRQCPRCGGQVDIAGRGVLTCKYCGTDIFIPK